MSIPKDCCRPCPETEVTNIPGPEGEAGADGAPGINAFTITTADFTVPNIGDTVTIQLGSSAWMTVGQNIFVEGAGVFSVNSKPGSQSATIEYLDYAGNTNAGNDIASGAQVSPAGTQPSVTLLPGITAYATGGSQALTDSAAQLLAPSLTLAAKTYLLLATYRIDFDIASLNTTQVISLKLRETTNGPADIPNATVGLEVPVTSTKTGTFIQGAFPPVTYAAADGDTIQMFGSIDNTPYAGAMNAVEVSLVAIPLF